MCIKNLTPEGFIVNRPEVQAGDVGFSENSWMYQWLIKAYQKQSSPDGKAEYGHAFNIIDSYGNTFESLSKYKHQNLFKSYSGEKILIGRHEDMTPEKAMIGYDAVKWRLGYRYPWWRIIALGLGCAKWVNVTKLGDCSETMYEYLYHAGVCDDQWNGKTPDNGADMVRDFKKWSVVFEGVLP